MLAGKLGSRHITVNAIAPGPFESKMMAVTLERAREVTLWMGMVVECGDGWEGRLSDLIGWFKGGAGYLLC